MRITVIGSGISGLGAAHALAPAHDVTVFERSALPGGHTRTTTVTDAGRELALDTGFIVHNHANYPLLSGLFQELGVGTQPSEMSFSVSAPGEGLEYSPTRAWRQPGLLRRSMAALLAEIVRFTLSGRRYLATTGPGASLADLVRGEGYSPAFRDRYLIPMTAAIWSSSPRRALEFPALYALRFFDNHGLLGPRRHRWRTVVGGASTYVDRIADALGPQLRTGCPVVELRRDADGVSVRLEGDRVERFDAAVVATHADQALALLGDPDDRERRVLGAFSSTESETVLHTDERLLPHAPAARASWNYRLGPLETADGPVVTYYLNRLQRIESDTHYCVSLNQVQAVNPDRVIARIADRHPLYTFESIAAQEHLPSLSGRRRTWFCGAYHGFGFHEDGLASGLTAADAIRRSA
ncbi:MAG: NAD(P)/FAD-dependent oxidoreductase [Miltoncostaeaceae bacterium]